MDTPTTRPSTRRAFPSNWELSTARAVNVVHFLADTAGVDPAKLTAAGYSQYHPRGSERALNRRIEILLIPQLGGPAPSGPAATPAAGYADTSAKRREMKRRSASFSARASAAR